tara:strand:- start:592 stop:1038 length:447 start_codon:yes stop_codon:yes gene_type:complete
MKTKPKNILKETFIEVCNRNNTMAKACRELRLHFTTFKKYAQRYKCYNTNQAGKGITKNIGPRIWDRTKWDNNEVIDCCRLVIRKWIIRLNLLPYTCNVCKINEWEKKSISLELNHINGNNWEHRKSNLEWLCPNCHSQTNTFRGKNK